MLKYTIILPLNLIMQVLDINPKEEEKIVGANVDLDSQHKGKSVVIVDALSSLRSLNLATLWVSIRLVITSLVLG